MSFTITINSVEFPVDLANDTFVTPTTTLAEFIRNRTTWRGTKIACAEGGCGACTVALGFTDPSTGKAAVKSINSCLALLLTLNGMKVVTNEGIGNTKIGYNPIQTKLAALSGTQCGYCSSGMVMLLYAYLQQHPAATTQELEAILDGNLCRCTGYRPILDTFKTFAGSGAASEVFANKKCMKENCCQKKDKFADLAIEDAAAALEPGSDEEEDAPPAAVNYTWTGAAIQRKKKASIQADASSAAISWQDATSLKELQYYVALAASNSQNYMITVGATSKAIYPQNYAVYINATSVAELQVLTQSATGITIGSAVTVADALSFISSVKTSTAYQTQDYPALASHLGRVAGTSIRNRASVGGNLMLVHQHQSPTDFFPSDVFIALLGINATLTIVNSTGGAPTTYSLSAFLQLNMQGMILVSIFVPFATSASSVYKTYKIAKRSVMSHALVNAAFKVDFDAATSTITGGVVIAIGGVLAQPIRVTAIENALVGQKTTSVPFFQTLVTALKTFLQTNLAPAGGRAQFRVQTAVNYFYKFFLALQPSSSSSAAYAKAAEPWMTRPVSSASQTFGSDPNEYPVSLPIPKIDGLAQTSGEAMFTADVPMPYGTVHGAIVQSTQANATIASVNSSVVANVPGFVKYYDKNDIPAANNSFGVGPIFAQTTSDFAGQCIGLVVATTRQIALQCAAMIQATVTYSNVQTPILTPQQALDALWIIPFPVLPVSRGQNPDTVFPTCANVVEGTLTIGSQYHVHLENHATLVEPIEGQYQIECASQCPIGVQQTVAGVLGIPAANIQVTTRRCGGGFGAKVAASNFTSSLASIVARDLQVPVSIELTLQDPMRGLGSRPQYLYQFKAGLDASNKIIALKGMMYLAVGFGAIDCLIEAPTALGNLDNCYNIPNFLVEGAFLKTNIAPGTSVRGPGWIQAVLLQEMVINSIAAQLKVPPMTLRETNFYQRGDVTPVGQPLQTCNLQSVWSGAIASSNYQARVASVAAFNAANMFVKRGISINPVRFGIDWSWAQFNSTVAVYGDGSIAVTHGGCEIGQGINTKVAQVVAYKFGLTAEFISKIKIQPSNTRVTPNPMNMTGGSITSELCCLSVMHACEELYRRLRPFLVGDWAVSCAAASTAGVDMLATGYSGQPKSPAYPRYNSWACAVTEVEVDGLTGQHEIKRTDIVFDCGISLNPAVDIGQVEGGFTFGLGWFTQETTSYDPVTGQAKDASTWEYKPPMAADIPEVLNVTLLENSSNSSGVLSSKACSEPPVGLAVSVVHALENAINAVRAQVGTAPTTVTSVPLGVDQIAALCGVPSSAFTF